MTLVNEHVNGEITSIKPDKKQAYSYLRNKAVQFTPSHLACQFACGGSSCKYCNDIAWTEKQQVIKGLYSNWINEDILAMARPIEPNIIKHDMIKQFRENNIVSLINLQVAGEHSKCGSYMHKSGFSYDPEMFMKQKIFYYNFPMQDFDSTDVQGLLSIAKVIHFAVQQGKVAIHCHAGLGRTGMIIAAYLIATKLLPDHLAIDFVRAARKNSIQTYAQINVLNEFYKYCLKYGSLLLGEKDKDLNWVLEKQKEFIGGREARKYIHIPKIIEGICLHLLQLKFRDGLELLSNDNHLSFCTLGHIKVNWNIGLDTSGYKLSERIIAVINNEVVLENTTNNKETVRRLVTHSLMEVEKGFSTFDATDSTTALCLYLNMIKRPFSEKETILAVFEAITIPFNVTSIPVALATHENWKCLTFYLCRVFSLLLNQEYEYFPPLLTKWIYGTSDAEITSAIRKYMRDLFAQHLTDQDSQIIEPSLLQNTPNINDEEL